MEGGSRKVRQRNGKMEEIEKNEWMWEQQDEWMNGDEEGGRHGWMEG